MKREEIFNDILDACLEGLARGDTPEQCLARYPEQAAQLEPLLRTAAEARAAVAITPRTESRARGWLRLSEALRETRPARASFFSTMPRWAVATTVLIVFLAAGGATAGAAAGSLPDNFLYPVKLATEKVQLSLTFSHLGKTELLVRLADRRVSEITRMAEKGMPDKMVAPARRLDELLAAVTGPELAAQPTLMKSFSVSPAQEPPLKEMIPQPTPAPEPGTETPEARGGAPPSISVPPTITGTSSDNAVPLPPEQAQLIELLRRYQTEHPEKLQAVLEKAPPELRALLESIISRSRASYQQLLDTWQKPLP
ncbi:MAG: DUF5667 domain-containing protein [Chloroflexota bacterium]